ncbi:MAG: shikimate dehydrogenase, partial [Candidatus Thorarchaeota archaeon]
MKRLVLVGYPLGQSLSPLMHNAALKAMNLESEYRYDIQPTLDYELQSFVESVKDGIVEGANITIPYKTDVINHVAI